jgi:hypothetical protein
MKNQVIAVVGPCSSRHLPVSNCEVSTEKNTVILTDPGISEPFIQKGEFDVVAAFTEDSALGGLEQKVPPTGNYRIVSLCSQFSIPPAAAILRLSQAIAAKRFPGKSSGIAVPISIGFLHDDYADDFLALDTEPTETLEFVDTYELAELLDLLECAFEKLKRIRESVLVLRIGAVPFFEWIIVPRVDTFTQTPSISNLSAAHLLVFILKKIPDLTDQQAEYYAGFSRIFRLISDSFLDIPTVWVCHIAENVTFRSNAAILSTAACIRVPKTLHARRSDIIRRHIEDDAFSESALSDTSAKLGSDDLRDSAYLKEMIGEYSLLKPPDPRSQKASGKPQLTGQIPYQKLAKLRGKPTQGQADSSSPGPDGQPKPAKRARAVKKPDEPDSEPEEEPEEPVDLTAPIIIIQREEEEEESGGEEEEEEERIDEIDQLLRPPKRKWRKEKKPAVVIVEPKPREKTREEIEAEAAEIKAKEEAEHAAIREQLSRFRHVAKKSPESAKPKPAKKQKADASVTSASGVSGVSRQKRVAERIAKLQQLRAEEEEDDYDDEAELKRYKRRDLTPYEKREKKFNRLKILILQARKEANSRKPSDQKLTEFQEKLATALADAKKTQDELTEDLRYQGDVLKYKRANHREKGELLKDLRWIVLQKHSKNLDTKNKQTKPNKGKQKMAARENLEYDQALEYLKKKKRDLLLEIDRLKTRVDAKRV